MRRLLLFILFGLHIVFGAWFISEHSATFDEPMHVSAGYALLNRRDARLDVNNPPLAKLLEALPLIILKPSIPWNTREWREAYHYPFGERMFYWSGNDADKILAAARSVPLLFSCGLMFLLWRFSRKRWGEGPAALCAAVYAFCPAILSHASLATNDFPSLFFTTIALMVCAEFLAHPTPGKARGIAALSLAAFLCKYSAVLLWPTYFFLFGMEYYRKPTEGRDTAALFAKWGLVPFCVGLIVYFLIYPQGLPGFLTRLWQVGAGDHPSYLLGQLHEKGVPHYYAVILAAKSTWVEWFLLGSAVWAIVCRKVPADLRPIGLAAVLYFTAASLGGKQIGLRYILLVYPALALASAAVGKWMLKNRKYGPSALWVLGGVPLLLATAAGPHFLSYAHPWWGAGENAHHVMVDSNIDWGQELKHLSHLHKKAGRPEVVLAYFGTGSSEYYGVLAQTLVSAATINRRHMNSPSPSKEWLVVSATYLAGAYVGRDMFAWLRAREPDLRAGSTLFIYDITRDAQAHEYLAKIYENNGDPHLAMRESGRAERLRAVVGAQ